MKMTHLKKKSANMFRTSESYFLQKNLNVILIVKCFEINLLKIGD